ncbi:MAG: phospholipase/Carboxylesterase [Crocinitomicaceae bacterium]|nr:phospholipase/Carboxylesterase [Crocinitomicaceae bacterium]
MGTGILEIQKTARYRTFGDESNPHLIIALHGYGQLAEYFIRNFESLDPGSYFIVAPEGMHRFYLQGSSGRVGASWMTKEWREQDIEENVLYMEKLTEHLASRKNYETVTLLGFSQGGATAARWLDRTRFKIDRFILWACVFPEDINPGFDAESFSKVEKIFVLGDEDEYFSGDNFHKMNAFYESHGFRVINFQGKHRIDINPLHLLFKKSE